MYFVCCVMVAVRVDIYGDLCIVVVCFCVYLVFIVGLNPIGLGWG